MESKNTSPTSISRRQALAAFVITPPLVFGLAASESAPLAGANRAAIRIAMLSFWHVHAGGYAQQALSNLTTAITAVWDEVPERGRKQAQALGVPFYEQLEDLLVHADVDGVVIDAPTTMHRKVMVASAQAGKHIFTEKVLAPTLRECNEIVAAVDKSGVKLMVSLPRLYSGSTLAIQEILGRKLLGEVTQVRIRIAHDGALRTLQNPQGWLPSYFFNSQQTAGGAMIDLGSHPMYLLRYFLGLPESVSASYGHVTGREVEDNAVVVLRYPRGTLGIVESGFVNPFSPFTIEAHGTSGSLLYGTPEDTLQIRGTLIGRLAGTSWTTWKNIPPDQPTAFQQWISHIQQGTKATENIQIATDLSHLMEAANRSASSNRPVRLNEL